jgi:phosphoribosylformylglycinamidine synthase
MYHVTVHVTYKESVLDPQGQAVKKAINKLGYPEVEEVRIGKYFEMQVAKTDTDIAQAIEAICDKLLANINMESYAYEIHEVVEA